MKLKKRGKPEPKNDKDLVGESQNLTFYLSTS